MPTKNNNLYARPFNDKCYRCEKVGHHSNEYPKRKVMNAMEKDNGVIENEVCEPDGMMIMKKMSKKSTLVW